jgi:acetyl-CoA C-acetyltransferase
VARYHVRWIDIENAPLRHRRRPIGRGAGSTRPSRLSGSLVVCFTIAELISYEIMGLTARGEGARAIMEGWTASDGRLPVNRVLKAKGHLVGATGVSMHVMAAMQLTGRAGALQLPRTDLAAVYNMGGSAVANYVSILEKLR